MMIGPAPMMRMVEISVRLGIGFLGSSLRAWLNATAFARKKLASRPKSAGRRRIVSVLPWGDRARPYRGDLKPRSLAENSTRRKGDVGESAPRRTCFRARKLSTACSISVYTKFMRIVWDEAKRLTNLAKHGLDFADLDTGFFSEAALGRNRQRPLRRNWRMGRDHDHSGLQTIGRRGHLGDFHATGEPKGAKTMTSKKFSAKRPLTR